MKILNLEEEFRISVETFFTFFFENANFKQKYHSSRGDNQIEVKAWTPTSDNRYTREVSFCSFISNNPVINRLVGDKAKVKEVQHYKYIENGSLYVSSETFFDGSSIGKSFSSVSEWTVSPISNPLPGCKVVIVVKNNYNGSMFKGVLENWVHDTTEDSFKQWLTLVRQQVEEYEKNEQLKRITPTPVKNNNNNNNNTNNKVKSSNNNNNNNSNNNNNNNSKKNITNYIDEDDEIMVDENQKSNKQQQQQQKYNDSNSVQHINSLNGNNNNNNSNGEEDFSDSELSDISRKAPSHLDFNSDDDDEDNLRKNNNNNNNNGNENFNEEEENEEDDEEDEDDFDYDDIQSTSDDKFYDSNDVWQISNNNNNSNNERLRNTRSKKDIKNFMININNDISHLKSIIEVNHNRLFGLEDAFTQIQKTNTTIITTQRSSPPLNHNNNSNNNNNNNNTTAAPLLTNTTMVDNTYLTKLEECVKNIQEDEIRTREKQKEWIEKISELERKLNSIGTAQSRSILWVNILALIFFLIGWPIVAKKLWKSLAPFLTTLLTRK
ncbi:hypothetical protein DDB_G0269840 [Dictyostelium discoideum AX4]|uniref:VASt domain-containing protein n=1 Tax=Dictyostelium discoideum TaxID=44689 RepID=Q55CZ7_DICDI|nr:hypothetical protein DDB_G0269840 [Dictyostelium discoideum AX4]EAL72270.1 hypothetical protein DDB_G0269840 [Dictyostelium discoideum AX4]|eukprot:XP_646334.1 hypothetical protein DDB_G0269840 [Dictyostelium discoideum AX4]